MTLTEQCGNYKGEKGDRSLVSHVRVGGTKTKEQGVWISQSQAMVCMLMRFQSPTHHLFIFSSFSLEVDEFKLLRVLLTS